MAGLLDNALEDEAQTMQKTADSLEKENYDFMRDFATTYASDAPAAKAKYYNVKVNIDTTTPEGDA